MTSILQTLINLLTPSEFVNRSIEYFNSSNHESISEIENNSLICSFKFHPIDVGVMAKTLGGLITGKPLAVIKIPAKVLSQSRLVISQPLTTGAPKLINSDLFLEKLCYSNFIGTVNLLIVICFWKNRATVPIKLL